MFFFFISHLPSFRAYIKSMPSISGVADLLAVYDPSLPVSRIPRTFTEEQLNAAHSTLCEVLHQRHWVSLFVYIFFLKVNVARISPCMLHRSLLHRSRSEKSFSTSRQQHSRLPASPPLQPPSTPPPPPLPLLSVVVYSPYLLPPRLQIT